MWLQPLLVLQGHNGTVHSVTFSPDGSKIISRSDDKTIWVWNMSTGIKMPPPLWGHYGHIYSTYEHRCQDASTTARPQWSHLFHHILPNGSKIVSGSGDIKFGMWAQAWRCCHHCKATVTSGLLLHSCSMDQKLSLSLRAGPFEFGMWAQARCCHCCKAMMIAFVPLHSHLMDSKLPLHLGIKPFKFGMWAQVLRCCHCYQWIQNCLWVWWWEFGMQAQASRCCHHCKATIITFIPLHSCLMGPKLSLSLMTTPFKFWMQAQALMCCHYCNIMIKTFHLLHSHLMDPKSSPSLIMVPFKFGMWVQGSNFFHHSQQQLMMYSSLHQTVESFPLTRAWGGLQIQILVIVWAGSLLAIHIIISAFAALVVLDGLETSSSTHL